MTDGTPPSKYINKELYSLKYSFSQKYSLNCKRCTKIVKGYIRRKAIGRTQEPGCKQSKAKTVLNLT